MLNMRSLEAMTKAIAGVVREHVGSALTPLLKRMESFEKRMAEIRQVPEDLDAIVAQKAVDAVAALPVPQDGKDIDPEVLEGRVTDAVAKAVAALPAPKDGVSVTLEDVKPFLAEQVKAAVDEIPRPKDGESADMEALRADLARMVAELPTPEAGKSFTLDDALPLIDRITGEIRSAAERALSAVSQATAESIKSLDQAVAALRQPEDGKSVSIDDVEPILRQLVSELPGPKDGISVKAEDVRPMIEEIVSAAVSEALAKAIDAVPAPKDGEPGRNALDLEILPAIDEAKSYARGTYATHQGGVWRTFQTTEGMRGWECIVDGVAEQVVEQVDERSFVLVSRKSSGAEVRTAIAIPSLIDRGVYKAESNYQAGDGTTWAGSYWIAQKDEPIGKPGEPGSDGWRLAVKKGEKGAGAYQIAVRHGFQGTETEWLERIYTGKNPDRVVHL